MAAEHVWVIERGQYSSYTVVGVYDTWAKARAVADMLNADPGFPTFGATVRKTSLNPGFAEVEAGQQTWVVRMEADGAGQANRWYDFPDQGLRVTKPAKGSGVARCVQGYVWARSEQHALKIANEYRVRAIAEGRL